MDKQLFYTLCAEHQFRTMIKSIVKESVNDELFWSQLFESIRIQDKVNTEISKRVPKAIESKLDAIVPKKVTSCVLEILPSFLQQNKELANILNDHANRLNLELKDQSDQILRKIVSDPQYHEVNRRYFETFERNASDAIHDFKGQGKLAINEVKNSADKELAELREDLRMLNETHTQVRKLQTEVSDLRFQLSMTHTMIAIVVGLGCAVSGVYHSLR
jgi:hypothetical protein